MEVIADAKQNSDSKNMSISEHCLLSDGNFWLCREYNPKNKCPVIGRWNDSLRAGFGIDREWNDVSCGRYDHRGYAGRSDDRRKDDGPYYGRQSDDDSRRDRNDSRRRSSRTGLSVHNTR